MVKNIASIGILALTISALLYFSFGTNETFDSSKYSTEGLDLDYTVSLDVIDESTAPEKYNEEIFTPYLGKSFVGFKEALAFKESRGKYSVVNTYGYMGKYQFGKSTLKLLGVHNSDDFLSSPRLQENAFIANTSRNKWVLRRDIKNFVGKRVNGILVTESGILAAAHLAGPGSVKKFLRSYGIDNFSDGYGTTVGHYMKRFSGYDTSFIKPDKKAKAI
ncbi:peptidoglycan-binding protein LysM [Tamlana agarivorans]|uniref:Peptidoglycan-binding protein LysM n=1 Tax=Pseudotamlana agarivorans TaxID=481183 RepID=A0ACC5UBF6_9FLAO|nr:peptidoglycan-binding protein LysM [Tamlana agarivorans]MBU2951635.1 peptidoglycan-binding protein LysM [Tamlana agarivorans]